MERRSFLLLAGGALLSACTATPRGGSRPGDALVPLYGYPAKDEWPEEFSQLPATT